MGSRLAAKARQGLVGIGDGNKFVPVLFGGSLQRGGEEMKLPSVQGSWQKKGLPAWPRALQAEDLAVLGWGSFLLHLPPFQKA